MDVTIQNVQRSAKRLVRGCEKFVPALAYLFCLALPGSCLARFAYFLADLCKHMGNELLENAPAARGSEEAGITQFLTHKPTYVLAFRLRAKLGK